MKSKIGGFLICCALTAPAVAGIDELKLDFHGAGWLQTGRIENSFALPSAGNDYEKNWVGQSGGLILAHSQIDEHWDAGIGLGTVLVQLARGSVGQANKWYPFWVSWVDEARFTYSLNPSDAENNFKLTIGSFHYGYSQDSKNLGLYLLHGYVYPGGIVSGFTGPLGVFQSVNGANASIKRGGFTNDFIVQVETEDKPLFDISVADIASIKFGKGIELGGGVNFYRVLPTKNKVTSPDFGCSSDDMGTYAKSATDNPCYIITAKDSAGNAIDSALASLSGIKLMGRLRIDPKAFLGMSEGTLFGKDDFVIYSELAVLGVKNYPRFYDKIDKRIPVMFGINLPGMNYLNASVEVEYYASMLSSDIIGARSGSPIPVNDDPRVNPKRDDWKWSFNASTVLGGHIAVMGQVANDHLRMGGNHDEDTGIEAMRTPEDWYWTTKIAYFF